MFWMRGLPRPAQAAPLNEPVVLPRIPARRWPNELAEFSTALL